MRVASDSVCTSGRGIDLVWERVAVLRQLIKDLGVVQQQAVFDHGPVVVGERLQGPAVVRGDCSSLGVGAAKIFRVGASD